MTDLSKLLELCAAEIDATHDRARAADADADAEAVKWAESEAVAVFGEAAAAALGEWLPLAVMDDDCLQASVILAPGVCLVHTAPVDSGMWFTLIADCRSCFQHRELRVGSLEGLAAALNEAGVRG